MNTYKRKTAIHDMESLEKEISRLKNSCREIEIRLDQNIEHLKDNYAVMALNSLLGNRLRSVPLLGDIAGAALNNQKIQHFIQVMVDSLVDKASMLAEKLSARFSGSKSDKSGETES